MNDDSRPRRLVVVDVNGADLVSLDLTGILNANAAAAIMFRVEDQCDEGFWHPHQTGVLNPWGPD